MVLYHPRPMTVRTTPDVTTSVTAFVAAFENLPSDPVRVQSMAEATTILGTSSDHAFALMQFFLNGGTDAWLATSVDALAAVNFNLLVLPDLRNVTSDDTYVSQITFASRYCEERGAFFILDPKAGLSSAEAMLAWATTPAMQTSASANCALYFPDVIAGDPAGGPSRTLGPSSTVAGIYAATDANRGVWQAPAGTETALQNVLRLTVTLSDRENATLVPAAINALRTFPVYGNLVWGARTRAGDDSRHSDFKYIQVRRTIIYIEQSLKAALGFAAYEPNGPELWSQMTTAANAFLSDLFRQGAFQGATPHDAYFVTCDATTNPPSAGQTATMQVAVAMLQPAEFIVLTLEVATA